MDGRSGEERVFVPTIMGVGLAVSLGLIVAEATSHVAPRSRALRRHRRIDEAARRRIEPALRAIGAHVPPPEPARVPRSRRFYGWVVTSAITYGVYVLIGSTANFLRPYGPFSGHLAMQAVSVVASIAALLVGVVAGLVFVAGDRVPAWARWFVEHTPLGHLDDR